MARKYDVRSTKKEQILSSEPCYYRGTLIGEEKQIVGVDSDGNTYKRIFFEPRLGFPELLELFDDMPVGERLHLRTSAPYVEKAFDCLGLNGTNLRLRIGDGELADYITDVLKCKTRSDLFRTDAIAYDLLKQRRHLKEELLPSLKPRTGRKPSKKKKKRGK
jgi:hypothetical protein